MQRWAIIKKRQGNLTLGTGSQLSEVQLAARRAVSLALNMPMGDTLKSSPSISSGSYICVCTCVENYDKRKFLELDPKIVYVFCAYIHGEY